jgi:hypothetical protein
MLSVMTGDADDGRKHQHSHTRKGRVYGKEEKPTDDARCALNAAITQ